MKRQFLISLTIAVLVLVPAAHAGSDATITTTTRPTATVEDGVCDDNGCSVSGSVGSGTSDDGKRIEPGDGYGADPVTDCAPAKPGPDGAVVAMCYPVKSSQQTSHADPVDGACGRPVDGDGLLMNDVVDRPSGTGNGEGAGQVTVAPSADGAVGSAMDDEAGQQMDVLDHLFDTLSALLADMFG